MAELKANQANWNDRVAVHLGPNGYDVAGLSADLTRLSGTVSIDAPRLGSLSGLRVAHLQCHIGTDTLSLTRLGATCVGLDFSPDAIVVARELAEETNAPMTFVESPVYDACEVMGQGQFDLVYTTCGVINWLPEIGRWAAVVSELLKPGGRVYLRDTHPILYALDENRSRPHHHRGGRRKHPGMGILRRATRGGPGTIGPPAGTGTAHPSHAQGTGDQELTRPVTLGWWTSAPGTPSNCCRPAFETRA